MQCLTVQNRSQETRTATARWPSLINWLTGFDPPPGWRPAPTPEGRPRGRGDEQTLTNRMGWPSPQTLWRYGASGRAARRTASTTGSTSEDRF